MCFDSFRCSADETDCQDCDVARENEELKEIVEELNEQIEKLEKRIDKVRQYTLNVYRKAAQVLMQRSGVPRGTWAFWKGAGGVARRVYNMLTEVV